MFRAFVAPTPSSRSSGSARVVTTLFLLLAATACALPQHIAERQALKSQVESWDAQSRANAEKNGASATLYAGAAGMQPMTTVPFAEAPSEGRASEWYCFEYRSRNGEPKTSSACEPSLDACRRAAAERAKYPSGSTHDPVSYDVGSCARQSPVTCSYLWNAAGSGQYMCYRAAQDCMLLAYSMPGGANKQTECGELR